MNIVEVARKAIKTYFSKEDFEIEEFDEKKGIFVTLYKNGKLRGCIGFIEAVNLNKGIIEAARAAAFSDPRFMPLQENELDEIKIEVSLLTEPELVRDFKKIKIGEDGLIVEKDISKGLLLPSVFVEYSVNVEEALRMTCEKAGLDKDAWKEKDVKVYKFQCVVYKK